MNKKFTYIAMICLFLGAVTFVVFRYNNRLQSKMNAFYPLQERKGMLGTSAEWATTKTKAGSLYR